MSESRYNEETLTTTDFAYPERAWRDQEPGQQSGQDVMSSPAAANDDTGNYRMFQPAVENHTEAYTPMTNAKDELTPVSFHGTAPEAQVPGATATSMQKPSTVQPGPLFLERELETFRARWDQVQVSFVDEPRVAVHEADSLVANVVNRIGEQFSAQRETLEGQWEKGEEVSTEELRQALKQYRSLFQRLLTV